MSRRFSKILIANRGEIACRVIRSAQSEGYATVAVYSDADRDAPHVGMADEAVRIGPAPVGESYLDGEKVLEAAKKSGADAIHPGYGFLSENAPFAAACAEADITFIGPASAAIESMGNKAQAKVLMEEAKVPCVPGYSGSKQDDKTLKSAIEETGYPALLKAVAGGGGRGMRVIRTANEVDEALATARAEAKSAFGSDCLLVEKLLEKTRHVEIQVIADEHGNCIHLGERDCSVQRRHQKIVEESPCPVMTTTLRNAMGSAAVAATLAAGYVNAGTIEFLLDDDGNFYFLEMNTRLQVEHPVTEMVTGLDLVALQFSVAQGLALPLSQEDVCFDGHAMEVRLYAEDPALDFAPQLGNIHCWRAPEGCGVRVDHALKDEIEITPYYDAMLAKIIAWGKTREESRARLTAALRDMTLLGVPTNQALLEAVLNHPEFASGNARTDFVDDSGVLNAPILRPALEHLLVAAAILIEREAGTVPALLKGWRSTGRSTTPVTLTWNDETFALYVSMRGDQYELSHEEEEASVQIDRIDAGSVVLHNSGHSTTARFATNGNDLYLGFEGRIDHFRDVTYAPPEEEEEGGDGILKAPMIGQVVELHGSVGDRVSKGDVLVVLEAMKMVNQIVAPFDGTIESLNIAQGDRVEARQTVLKLAQDDGQA
jgi:geranyl-CoA carboxylase alpha subunit